jgi:hypothetical protein
VWYWHSWKRDLERKVKENVDRMLDNGRMHQMRVWEKRKSIEWKLPEGSRPALPQKR